MVAWGSFYADSQVNITASEAWIKKYAMKAPASHFILNGRYNINLLQPATTVSDSIDSNLCPKKQVKVVRTYHFNMFSLFKNELIILSIISRIYCIISCT